MLEIHDLKMVYPNGFEAIRSASFTVGDGEILGLIGRSGSGKSTLLRCINGIQRPTAGRVLLDGENITALSDADLCVVKRRIGFIWQEFNVVERLTAMENVLCGRLGHARSLGSLLRYFNRTERAVAVRSLERVSLLHRGEQRADRLSGGEKQRVSIARALAQEPRVILADEPVASLDPELAWQVMSLLSACAREEGVPTVIAIHAVDLARAFTDRIVAVARGAIVYDGPPTGLTEAVLDRVYRDGQPASNVQREWHEPVLAATA
ncbi:MAG: phosphonate ABC transporter ATP-binding protein [Chloroflexota bacterium]